MLLVTGASSPTGSAIVRRFAANGHPARGLTRSLERVRALADLPGVELVEGDMTKPNTLGRALDGVRRALVISSVQEDLVGTQRAFIAAAKAAGVQHVVKISGEESGIGFDPDAFRGTRAHMAAERELEASGVAWTMLRPSQFMQFYLRRAADIGGGVLALPMGTSQLSPIDIEDLAQIAVAVMTTTGHEGQRYRMTGPEALTTHEVAAAFSEGLARPVRYVDVPPDEFRARLAAAGSPEGMIGTLDEVFAERRRCPIARVDLSTHERFGVRPTRFVEFARRMRAAFVAA
jgi:uncharacterized protein YbjT (DUF2867 family)